MLLFTYVHAQHSHDESEDLWRNGLLVDHDQLCGGRVDLQGLVEADRSHIVTLRAYQVLSKFRVVSSK